MKNAGYPFLGIGIFIAVMVFSGGLRGLSGQPSAAAGAAPDFALRAVSLKEKVSLAGYRGRYVLVNFSTTWCPHCRAERATLDAFYDQYRGQRFALVSVDVGEGIGTVQDLLRAEPVSYEVVLDFDGAVADQYGVSGYPSTFLIDPQGQIVDRWIGELNRGILDHDVAPLLRN